MSRRGWFLFALMCVIWGIPYLLIKVAVEEVSAPFLVFVRTALGAAVLLPLAARGGGLRSLRGYGWVLAVFAGVEIIGPWMLLSDAERRISSSMTGLLIAAVPIIGAVLAMATGSTERLGPVRWAGLVVGFGGVAVLAAPSLHAGSAWAVGEVLLTALGYSIAPMIAERRLKDVPILPLTGVCLAFSALVYTGPAAATWPDRLPSAKVLAALGGLALVCTALAFVLLFELIREVGASRAVVFTYVNPAVALTAGILLLNEPFTATVAVSFALILTGSVLATRPARAGTAVRAEPAPDLRSGAGDSRSGARCP